MYHFVYHIARPFYYRQVTRFLAGASHARRTQHTALLDKLRRNANSDFGREHGFSKMHTADDFRRRMPITDYEYYRKYVERVKQGDVEAMFAPGTKILMFALTSGTTNKSKYIPVTREFFEEYRRSWYIWAAQNYNDHRQLLAMKTLKLGSNWRQFYTEAGIPCGNISGLATELAPWFTRPAFAIPMPVTGIDDPAAKHYTALRVTIATPRVGMIITANPSTLVAYARRSHAERELLIRDIHDGTLSHHVEVSDDIRQALKSSITQRNPQRARELERIVERTGTLFPKDFWPQLSVLAVWMGGSVGIYLPQLEEFYGQVALRDHGLSASEGRMTIPIQDNTSEGILDYPYHYYEFIPEDEMNSHDPTVLEAHELEIGKNYFILLTTSSGLYRYDIRDVVQCVDYHGQAPILKFLNKGAHFSSFTGEKLSEFQVVSAVKQTFAELEMPVEHFTVAPVMNDNRPGYVLLVEPSSHRPSDREFVNCVEGNIKRLNIEYADKLDSGRLLPMTVQEVPTGTWDAFRRRRTSERGNLEEYKHPCLVNDLGFVDNLLKSELSQS